LHYAVAIGADVARQRLRIEKAIRICRISSQDDVAIRADSHRVWLVVVALPTNFGLHHTAIAECRIQHTNRVETREPEISVQTSARVGDDRAAHEDFPTRLQNEPHWVCRVPGRVRK